MAARRDTLFAPAPLPKLLRRLLGALLSTFLAAQGGFSTESGESELDLALAGVVDTHLWPEEAAALEARPYRMLLEKVRMGPDEVTMSHYVAERRGSAEKLLRSPEESRGRSVYFTTGIIVELRRVRAPGVGRFDRDEVYAGIVAEPRSGPVGSTASSRRRGPVRIELWAIRALRLAHEPRLYPGDRVNVSGYFFKNVPVVDAKGGVRWMPLLVCPWPTYYGKWTPIGPTLRMAGATDLLPTCEYPHEEIASRLVLDIERNGSLALGGSFVTQEQALAELRRYAFRHPGRAVVVRLGGGASEKLARSLKEESGLRRMLPKDLARPRAP